MPDSKLTDLGGLAAIVPANLLLYVVDTSEAVLANKSKKLAYTLFQTYTDARYLQPADVALVATTGAYADLTGKPALSTVATSGAYGDLSGLPTLGTLAAFNDAPSNGSQYARLDGAWAVVSGGVTSVFTRTGAVVSASGDYTASQVTNTPAGNIQTTTVQAALNELDTEKQPLDGTLTAYAALTGAANKLPYFTGADTFALADFSAFGRNLVDDADAAAVIATLGVLQPPFTDTNALVKGSVDPTKQLRWEIDGLTAGATRVMTPPNQDALLAGQDFANTFTVPQIVSVSSGSALTIKPSSTATTLDLWSIASGFAYIKVSDNAGVVKWILGRDSGTNFRLTNNALTQTSIRINESNNFMGLGAAVGGAPTLAVQVFGAVAASSGATVDAAFGVSRATVAGTAFGQMLALEVYRWEDTGSPLASRTAVNIRLAHGATAMHDTTVMTIRSDGRVGVGQTAPIGQLSVKQGSTTAAISALQLEQLDLSEELIEFTGTVATGNPIEAVGAKTLTTTHFIRMSVNGSFVYIPVGTIA